ncbi:GNAT family N-acetyltransferase [Ningiella sp. W23]|uniref:GNAT family N-acetyltransferase n=1 Tax=Ningiella sp. W23 TaxID=3023715 RepID=UPI003757B5BF
MTTIRKGQASDSKVLASLILSSAEPLLPYIFGSRQAAYEYLCLAGKEVDGQYSSARHYVAETRTLPSNQEVKGCMSLWHHEMPSSFHQATVTSLSNHLCAQQLKHIISINDALARLFLPPSDTQLCIGHLAVANECQGEGIGGQLIAHAVECAKNMSKSVLVLDVDVQNHQAVGFYEKHGFSALDTRHFAPTQQSFIRMERGVGNP